MAARRQSQVTNFGFSVSTTHSNTNPGGYATAVLNVSKHVSGAKYRKGDHDGRLFPNAEVADAFKIERGYTVFYRNARYATAKKVYRTKLKELTRAFRDGVTKAATSKEVFDATQAVQEFLTVRCGFDRFDAMHVSNSLFASARKIRPDLFPAPKF